MKEGKIHAATASAKKRLAEGGYKRRCGGGAGCACEKPRRKSGPEKPEAPQEK